MNYIDLPYNNKIFPMEENRNNEWNDLKLEINEKKEKKKRLNEEREMKDNYH